MRLLAFIFTIAFFGCILASKDCKIPPIPQCTHMNNDETICVCQPDPSNQELCCDLKGMAGKVQRELIRFYREVVVKDSAQLEYLPDCTLEQNITFINVQHGIFNNFHGVQPFRCNVNVHMRSSSFNAFFAIDSLTMINSHVDSIAWADDFEEFRIDNSSIGSLKNFSLVQPLYITRECFIAQQSIIYSASHIHMTCDMVMDFSEIKFLEATRLYQSRITSSTFGNITRNGLSLMRGWHRIRDVTFRHLDQEALVFGFESDITIINVAIYDCKKPCIKIEGSFVHAHNISVNGVIISNFLSSDFVTVLPSENFHMINTDDSQCEGNVQRLTCNLSLYKEYPVVFTPSSDYSEVVVTSHHDVGIFTDCYRRLSLNSMVGYVRETKDFNATSVGFFSSPVSKNETCEFGFKEIYIEDSKLRFLHASNLHGLFMRQSGIGSLEIAAPVGWLDITGSAVHSIETLEYYRNPYTESEFTLSQVSVSSMYHLYLRSAANFYGLTVDNRVVNMTLDLEGPLQTVVMEASVIGKVYTNGITVVKGVLALDQVMIHHMDPDAIQVHKGGKLLITGPKDHSLRWGCSDFGPSIVVDTRAQVVFTGALVPSWLRYCTRVRPGVKFDQDLKPGYVVLRPEMCTLTYLTQFFCNETNEEGMVIGGNNFFDDVTELIIADGKNLIIKELCLHYLTIRNISHVTFEKVENSCYFQVNIKNSSIDQIRNNVINMGGSFVEVNDLIPSAPMEELTLENSHVRMMKIVVNSGTFGQGSIDTIESLTVLQNFGIFKSVIGTFQASSVIVEKDSRLMIDDCIINQLNVRSFTVYGTLHIENSVIKKAVNMGIILHPDAVVQMDNVTITSNVPYLFIMEGQRNFDLDGVRIHSDPVRIIQNFVLVNKINGTDSEANVASKSVSNQAHEKSTVTIESTSTSGVPKTSTLDVSTAPTVLNTSEAIDTAKPVTTTVTVTVSPTESTPKASDMNSTLEKQDTISSNDTNEAKATKTEHMVSPTSVAKSTATGAVDPAKPLRKTTTTSRAKFFAGVLIFCGVVFVLGMASFVFYKKCWEPRTANQNVELAMEHVPNVAAFAPEGSPSSAGSTIEYATDAAMALGAPDDHGASAAGSSSSAASVAVDPGAYTKDPRTGAAVLAKETSPAFEQDTTSVVMRDTLNLLE